MMNWTLVLLHTGSNLAFCILSVWLVMLILSLKGVTGSVCLKKL